MQVVTTSFNCNVIIAALLLLLFIVALHYHCTTAVVLLHCIVIAPLFLLLFIALHCYCDREHYNNVVYHHSAVNCSALKFLEVYYMILRCIFSEL